MLCFIFKKSSAHFNPAVTIAFWANHDINAKRAFYNILAQFIGAVLAAAVVYVIAGLATPDDLQLGNQ
ncbi:hypothetical protein FACS1894218_5620 [Bacilli bacterium]|nr:hypothetical protein FACS1894218_5620 [Bacilli bacterium]